jgi:hypothetical protein
LLLGAGQTGTAENPDQPAPGATQAIVMPGCAKHRERDNAMRFFSRRQETLSEDEQRDLDDRLIDSAKYGTTEMVQTLLTAGADVHAGDDWALRLAASNGHTETVQVLLAADADVHAHGDEALRWAARNGRTGTLRVLTRHIFAADSWRGKNRTEIEAYATALYDKVEATGLQPERLHQAATILADCAIDCWHHVRPPPPPGFKISPLPAQPRPL